MTVIINLLRIFSILILLTSSTFLNQTYSENNKQSKHSFTIAAASDLKFAMDEIINGFLKENQNTTIKTVFGSSGKIYNQIRNQAPFDLFFSADKKYPKLLKQNNMINSQVTTYAYGRLVLWSNSQLNHKLDFGILTSKNIKKIAIANPRHAPYGMRAVEALKHAQVYSKIKKKLVYGDNIAHTAQFVQTKNAQIGIIALALIKNPNLINLGQHWLIPKSWHQPIEQAYTVTNQGMTKKEVFKFIDFFNSDNAKNVLLKYGFELPDQTY